MIHFSLLKEKLEILNFSVEDKRKLKAALSQAKEADEQFTVTWFSLDSKIANSIAGEGCVISDEGFQLLVGCEDLRNADPLIVQPDPKKKPSPTDPPPPIPTNMTSL